MVEWKAEERVRVKEVFGDGGWWARRLDGEALCVHGFVDKALLSCE